MNFQIMKEYAVLYQCKDECMYVYAYAYALIIYPWIALRFKHRKYFT